MFDPHTRESRGFGFIRMQNPDDAERAIAGISGTEVDGRVVTVEKAKRSRPRTPTPGRYYGPPKRGGAGGRKLAIVAVM
jgi:transformer-2 protein